MATQSQGIVTGASGLLGRFLCHRLARSGLSVIGITTSGDENQSSDVEYKKINFSLNWAVDDLPKNLDFIVHLAQSPNFRDFPDSALDVFRVNIESTARLLDYAKKSGVKKFVYASSGGVYGNGTEAIKENAPIVPAGDLGYYLGSKACGEILVQSYAAVFDVVIVRPFFIYGPGQKRGMLIPRLFDAVATGKPIILQGDSGIRINPIHVHDAASAIAATLKLCESAIFNVAGPEVLSIRQICEGMGYFLGLKPAFERQPGEARDLIADISAMKEKLVVPRRHLLNSLAEIAEVSER